MIRTKYLLSILAIAAVLITGSLAISPIAIADDDEEVEASIEAELKLEQDGDDVIVEVEAEGLASDADFTVRAYKSDVNNCMRGAGNALAGFDVTSSEDGELEISGTISDKVVDDVGSVSIRSAGSPGSNPPVVCFQDTND